MLLENIGTSVLVSKNQVPETLNSPCLFVGMQGFLVIHCNYMKTNENNDTVANAFTYLNLFKYVHLHASKKMHACWQ